MNPSSPNSKLVGSVGRSRATKIGVVGDVHQRLDDLLKLLDGPLAGCRRVIAAGDFVDRGADDPLEVIDGLLDRGVELLVGNHEVGYLGGPSPHGLNDDASVPRVPLRLRELVLSGQLRAAAVAGDVLVVHGGVSRLYWKRHLRAPCGTDLLRIARTLNARLTEAVVASDFSDPAFAAVGNRIVGPFWANFHDDLTRAWRGLPPIRQAVGHTIVPQARWYEAGAGAIYPLEWGGAQDGVMGYLVVEERP